MAIDPRIPLMGRGIQLPDPLGTRMDRLSLRGLMQEQQMRDRQMQKMDQNDAHQAEVMRYIEESDLPPMQKTLLKANLPAVSKMMAEQMFAKQEPEEFTKDITFQGPDGQPVVGLIGKRGTIKNTGLSPYMSEDQKAPKVQTFGLGGNVRGDYQWDPKGMIPGERHPTDKQWVKMGQSQGVSNVSATAVVGDKSYLTKRFGDLAEPLKEMGKEASSLHLSNTALDRMATVNKDAYAGATQPAMSFLANLFSGITGQDPKSLTNTVSMQQAIASIKANYMKQLGARGLTDADMKILGEALPQMNTSKAARTAVINIIKKANNYGISQYKEALNREVQEYPELKGKQMRPYWLDKYDARGDIKTINGKRYEIVEISPDGDHELRPLE